MLRVVTRKGRGRDVVTAPPDLHLLGAVPLDGLRLVEPLQRAVVTLVQTPAALDRKPHLVELIERDPERADRPLEHRGERLVEGDALGAEQTSGLLRLEQALRRKIDVDPAREQVLEVPGALPVSQQYQSSDAHKPGTSRSPDQPSGLARRRTACSATEIEAKSIAVCCERMSLTTPRACAASAACPRVHCATAAAGSRSRVSLSTRCASRRCDSYSPSRKLPRATACQ